MQSQTQSADNRALLFGARPQTYRRAPSQQSSQQNQTNGATTEREMLETANLQRVDGLRGRVGEMRHLALDLGHEVRDQNSLLDGMGSNFDNVGDGIHRTIAEVKRLAASGSPGHMCALFLFAFVFFILVYLLLRP